jgi:protein-disulfide isomerase/rhodanese-related sulfurtransferase
MRKILLLSFTLIGLFDSLYLWWVYTTPSRPMVCIGGGCDAVRMSPFAYPMGIPMPVFGVAMYASLALLSFAEPLFRERQGRLVRMCIAWISGLGFVGSLYLTGVEAFVLHAWCFWCVISATSVTLIFALAGLDIVRPLPEPDPAQAASLTKKHLVVVFVAVALGIPGFILLARSGTPPPMPSLKKEQLELLVRPDSHMTGNLQAALTVVEFGDIQCPACKRAEEATRAMRAKYGDRVKFVFRHMPLPSLHPHALKAAEATECAAAQGKFWEGLERFYAGQDDLSEESLVRYAGEMGLDKGQFRACLASGSMAGRVQKDADDARMLGLRATPTFFVGSQVIEGPIEEDLFGQLIRQELARAETGSSQASPSSNFGGASGSLASGLGTLNFGGASTGCSEADAHKKQASEIKTAEARQLYEGNFKPLFVDVREPKEYEAGRIAGAINIPADRIQGREGELPKDRVIVLYEGGKGSGDNICAAGRAAGRTLLADGFAADRVKVYFDGLEGWSKAGLPTE